MTTGEKTEYFFPAQDCARTIRNDTAGRRLFFHKDTRLRQGGAGQAKLTKIRKILVSFVVKLFSFVSQVSVGKRGSSVASPSRKTDLFAKWEGKRTRAPSFVAFMSFPAVSRGIIRKECMANGSTLVELMVATLILTIVLISSAVFFSTPPVMNEARRNAAVEISKGILDVMHGQAMSDTNLFVNGLSYSFDVTSGIFTNSATNTRISVSANFPPIPYTLSVTNNPAAASLKRVTLKLYDDDKALVAGSAYTVLEADIP